MGICLCTDAQAKAFAHKKISERYRHDDLLTTTELAIMISDVLPSHRKKAAYFIVNEHRKNLSNIPTSDVYVSSAFLPSNVFSTRTKGHQATSKYRGRPAHVLPPAKQARRQAAVAMVPGKEDM